MTSTTVDTEYKLNEDKTIFTKVYTIVNSQCRLDFDTLSVRSHDRDRERFVLT